MSRLKWYFLIMKKFILFTLFIFSFCVNVVQAQRKIKNITKQEWERLSEQDIYDCKCDQNRQKEMTLNELALWTLYMTNNANDPLYIIGSRTYKRGNFVIINESRNSNGNKGFLLINNNVLNKNGGRLYKGDELRIMTTAEELSYSNFQYSDNSWKFDTPMIDDDGKRFYYGNYKSDGNKPLNLTYFPNYDCELRVAVWYDYDGDVNTSNDNGVMIYCNKIIIR